MIRNTNDGSNNPPTLRVYMNMGNLMDLPAWSTGPDPSEPDQAKYERIKEAGFDGIQGGDAEACRKLGLGNAGGGRVNKPDEADHIARVGVDEGAECMTVHVAWGIEGDEEVDRLVGAILDASATHDMPIYIETHRATITDDMWRTVQLTERFDAVRFNGDFSHWYTGHEMPYGGFDAKCDFIEPVFERVRFMHGRIGNSGCMQVDIGDGEGGEKRPHVDHFREMWTRAMLGFLRSAAPGDYLVFAPELLPAGINYARTVPGPDGEPREEGDRWQQALLYRDIAHECFAAARSRLESTT